MTLIPETQQLHPEDSATSTSFTFQQMPDTGVSPEALAWFLLEFAEETGTPLSPDEVSFLVEAAPQRFEQWIERQFEQWLEQRFVQWLERWLAPPAASALPEQSEADGANNTQPTGA